ncbi:reproductive homeobox 4C isoform X1 [Mus musculus]|uniref:reproductive homeobox 4C isoform X1 n=1 Tax=Mus musculus TaxID=10090 RepID=UPI0003D6E885|nr:reproductive homeobox 4C isoform X1 [Mus musculus]|eukprot:XP_017174028.1 PREDICTED: reproductive homeobox 4C isoform X1 [Mus musculus]
MEHQNTNYLLHEGLGKDKEKLNGGKTQAVLPLDGEGRNEGESVLGQSGAAAVEGDKAEELSGEGGPAAGDADLMDNSNQEDQDTSGSAQEEEKLPEEPVLKDAVVIDKVQPIPVLVSGVRPKSVWVQQRSLHYNFQWWQLQELERIFQQNHFIRAEERHLARWIGVSETRVKRWFKKRREHFRRGQSQLGMNDDAPVGSHSTFL